METQFGGLTAIIVSTQTETTMVITPTIIIVIRSYELVIQKTQTIITTLHY